MCGTDEMVTGTSSDNEIERVLVPGGTMHVSQV